MNQEAKQIRAQEKINREMGPGYKIIGDYKDTYALTKILHEKCGTIEERRLSNIRSRKGLKPGCTKCRLESQTITDQDFRERLAKLKPDMELIGVYTNAKTKTQFRHKCGYTWEATPDNVLRRLKCCPMCGKNAKKSREQFVALLNKETKGQFELVGPYVTEKTAVTVKHAICGKTTTFMPHRLPYGVSCSFCSQSSGESLVSGILNSLEVDFVCQKRFSGCVYHNMLPFDFFIPKANLCIEYDGAQHYGPVNFGGVSDDELAESFNLLKVRDKIKDDFCKNNQIGLLRIPYYFSTDEMERVIKDALQK